MSVWREEDIKRKLIGTNLIKANLFGKTIGTGKHHSQMNFLQSSDELVC